MPRVAYGIVVSILKNLHSWLHRVLFRGVGRELLRRATVAASNRHAVTPKIKDTEFNP
jgi:hypothetical protein